MDLFNKIAIVRLGPGGMKCQCCDNGYCKKRKSKRFKNAWSKLRRTLLKRFDKKEIKNIQ